MFRGGEKDTHNENVVGTNVKGKGITENVVQKGITLVGKGVSERG